MNTESDDLTLNVVCDYNRLRYILFFSGDFDIDISKLEQLGFKYTRLPLAAQEIADKYTHIGLCRVVKIEDKEQAISEIAALNIPIIDHTSDGDLLLLEGNQERAKEQNFIIRTEIPEQPDIIAGRYWNHKFYGRPGNWSIYLDGERVQISDSEKSILDWYIKRLIDFESKVETGWDD
mgnify:FL=1